MRSLGLVAIVYLVVSVICQVVGLSLLPATQGFMKPYSTIAVSVCYFVGLGLMARLIHDGVNISVLLPFLAALIPLAMIAVGMIVYGETASPIKLVLLIVASGLVGFASTL
jgi:multidrug transporter EmrE-like cation transporter